MSVFMDSNVAVYAMVPEDAAKHAVAQLLVARHVDDGKLVVSTQVLQETFNVLTRKKQLPAEQALEFARLIARRRVVPSTADFVLKALQFSVQAQLSVWDALIVQAALDAGCATLLSEDLQHGRRFGSLEIVNPFLQAVHEAVPAYTAPRKRRR
jgi:predicted nucleic acid-binding protein